MMMIVLQMMMTSINLDDVEDNLDGDDRSVRGTSSECSESQLSHELPSSGVLSLQNIK